jgi:hypothetical protein
MQFSTMKRVDYFEEIERLYFIENLSQKAISLRLELDQSTVSRKIAKIRHKKGLHKKSTLVTINKGTFWRYHALHFVITPYYFYPKYTKVKESRGNYAIIEGDYKVKLHDHTIEMQLRQGIDYADEDKYIASEKAEKAFNYTLELIAHKYGFEVWKEGRASIRCVREHLARTNSPLAKARKGEYLAIRDHEGHVYFTIDKSKGLKEHEYIRNDRVMDDSERVEPYLNDFLYNQPLTNSQLAARLNDVVTALEKLTELIKQKL